jgi:O-antigen/teichoic acid export membrane protein
MAYSDWLVYLAIGSIIFLILSILLIPKIVARIPFNYFSRSYHQARSKPRSAFQWSLFLVKNVLGVLLVLSGLLMLVLPGQGLLTLFVGLLLLDFPGKYTLERYLIKKPAIRDSLNWLRRKQNTRDLYIDE